MSEFGEISSATAFSVKYDPIKNKSYFLTNYHFCSDEHLKELSIESSILLSNDAQLYSQSPDDDIVAKIIKVSKGDDLCLLEAHIKTVPLKIAGQNERIAPFEDLKIIGAPGGAYMLQMNAKNSYEYMPRYNLPMFHDMIYYGSDYIFLSAIVIPGTSGSPILNKHGRVVGIIFASSSELGALGINHLDIISFLEN